MKITICNQHLLGNNPDGFDATAWVAALEAAYRAEALEAFPSASVDVKIKISNASGYSSGVVTYFDDDGDNSGGEADKIALRDSVERIENWLFDTRGQEFFATEAE